MSVGAATVPGRPRPLAPRKLTVLELRLAWREPVGLILGVAVPIILLLIFGLSSSFQKRIVAGNPITWRTELAPVLIGLVLVLIALISLPIPIVTQRENRFLRRLSTTPVSPSWLLAAQVAVNLLLALVAIVMIVVGDSVFFGVDAPQQVAGFILSVLLATTSLFALATGCRRRGPQRPGGRCDGKRAALSPAVLRRPLAAAPEDGPADAPHQRPDAARCRRPRDAQLDAGITPHARVARSDGQLDRHRRIRRGQAVQMGVATRPR
jgi:ABC-type transport system involved in cytochrome c biogenesis permease component